MFNKIFSMFKKEPNQLEMIEEESFWNIGDHISTMQMLYLENQLSDLNKIFSNSGEYQAPSSASNGRELYNIYDIMDAGDGSAILDIYASSTISRTPMHDFRPFKVIIENRLGGKPISKSFWKFVEYNEEMSQFFNVLNGVARDGYKFGASYEKIKYGKSPLFGGRGVIESFESLDSQDIYPLHNGKDKTNITTYLEQSSSDYDYYDEKNFFKENKPVKPKVNKTVYKKYNPNIILPFFNRVRSTDHVGKSIFQPCVSTWTAYKTGESKMSLNRITTSGQKFVHSIETSGLSDEKIRNKIQLLKSINGTGRKILELSTKLEQHQGKIQPDPDMITFLKDGKGGLTHIQGDANISQIRDIDHWRHVLYSTCHVPPSYILDSSLKNASRDAVGEMDKLFETIISNGRTKIENTFIIKFYKTLIDLYFNRIGEHEKYKIKIEWYPISSLEDLRREKSLQIKSMIAKIWRLDLDIPDEVIYQKLFKMDLEEIRKIQKLPKPDPTALKMKTRVDDKGQNTTSPKTTPKASDKAKSERLEEAIEFIKNSSDELVESGDIEMLIEAIEEVLDKD